MSRPTPQRLSVLAASGTPGELAPIIDALQTSGFDVELVGSGREVFVTGRLRRHWSILADDTDFYRPVCFEEYKMKR